MIILINGIGCVGKSTLRKKLFSTFPNNVITVDMNYAKDIPPDTDKIVIVEATHSIEEYPQVFDTILYMLPPKKHTFLLLRRGWVWFSTGKVYLSHLQGKQKPFALSNIPVILKILFRTMFLKKRWVRDDLDLIKKKFESKTYISHSYNEGYKIVKSWIDNNAESKKFMKNKEDKMNKEYTRIEMLEWLQQHFTSSGYKVALYSKEFLPARVALYCSKTENNRIVEEIVVEPTTDESLSRPDFFPTLTIPNTEAPTSHPVKIPGASPIRFYQYYFPNAKIFLAYPDYVEENKEFLEFKVYCDKKGIGLLRTSRSKIEEVVSARLLFNEICNRLVKASGNLKNIEQNMEHFIQDYLHYLVYYPQPDYKRRAITGREEDIKGTISFCLIDKQQELKKIIYKEKLKELASNYRQKADSDYEIAEFYTKSLWKKYLGLEYPYIQKRVENILQRNEVYREHFVHQFQVFLIGAFIIDMMHSEIAQKFYKKHRCCIEKAWLAASTFHDFNYGLQNFDTWLLQFFEDTLRVRNKQTKENLNLLNLDSAMVREALYDKIVKLTKQLKSDWEKNDKENMILFFYEKAVRDRNHGVLSAISLLKLYDESNENDRKINEKGILESSIAIGCHDEDIWESLCGCQGYRRSPGTLPSKESTCIQKCNRKLLLWSSKKSRIYKEKIAEETNTDIADRFCCENWEREIMSRRTIDKIKFEDYPILFLLIFCDSIQDEGRITSSDNTSQLDLSKLIDVFITTEAEKILIDVKLESNNDEKKKEEIERVAWCLKDNRFRVSINGTLKIMDGNGGG